ncbi:MAG TPA: hypothetical protein VMT71_08525 [Syntrophorhabdales bacterium]|nr:hypothetical protein [Syntrophorhabdales bacterium]
MTSSGWLTFVGSRNGKRRRILIPLLALLLLVSCKTPFPPEPQKGDVRVIDGVEYIYGKNPKYMQNPQEPLYVWLRRDQYGPDTLDDFAFRAPVPSEKENALKARLDKLEAEYNKKMGIPSQPTPPKGSAAGSVSTASIGGVARPGSINPAPKLKRRVLVLPMAGATDPQSQQIAERVTARLIVNLENTGVILCIDPQSIGFRGDVAQPTAMRGLDEVQGIQAVVQGTVFDTPGTANKKISFTIYNAETGLILRQLTGNGAFLTKEQGATSPAESNKVIDLGIEPIAQDIAKIISSLDWHARVASTQQGKIFINAGKLSGLERGDTLEVYASGGEVVDATTKTSLGKMKGDYRGEIEVVEFVGADASLARSKKGDKFAPTDLVYLGK